MREKDDLHGFLVAVDGPNGVGKSTLIGAVEIKMKLLGYRGKRKIASTCSKSSDMR